MIKIRINPNYYTLDSEGSINGWALTSPFIKKFPDYLKFALVIGKSADIIIKSNYNITEPDFGGSRAIVVNHVGCEMHDSMFHSLVNNPNQYDYIVQVVDYMSRGHIKVYRDNVEMTTNQVLNFAI